MRKKGKGNNKGDNMSKRIKRSLKKPIMLLSKGELVDVYYQGNTLEGAIYLGFGPESAISVVDGDKKVTIIRDWSAIRSSKQRDDKWISKAIREEIL